MPSVAVVCDSTAYLPDDVLARLSIERVPLSVVFGDRSVRETEITDYPAFFDDLRSSERLPTTSQPSVGDFERVYARLLDDGRDVISLHISEALSGTAGSARQAAETLERDGRGGERVRVVDSRTAAGGLGICVYAAAVAAARGESLEEVERIAREARAGLKMWFGLDTLEFLRRGGRIGAASAWIGSTLRVKPILTVEDELTPVERVRTAGRLFERMVDYAAQRHDSKADGWVVQHIAVPDQAQELVERCRDVFGCDPLFIGEIGPVLSVHTGPGLLGVGSVPAHLVQ